MADRELEFTTRLAREDVAGVIEALVEGLKDGCLRVHKSSEVLELDVPRVVDLEIEAKINDDRAKFEIEVSWLTNRAGDPDDVPEPSTEPVTESCVAEKKAATSRGRKTATGKKASGQETTDAGAPSSGSAAGRAKSAPGTKAKRAAEAKNPSSAKAAKAGAKTGQTGRAGKKPVTEKM